MSTFFNKSIPAATIGLRQLRNPPSWILIFVVVSFHKVILVSEVLITFTMSFYFVIR